MHFTNNTHNSSLNDFSYIHCHLIYSLYGVFEHTIDHSQHTRLRWLRGGAGERALPVMDYTGRVHPTGVTYSGWRYGLHKLKYRKGLGKLSFRYLKGLSKFEEVEAYLESSGTNIVVNYRQGRLRTRWLI